jgi:probable F420-dependent oxidoreductase
MQFGISIPQIYLQGRPDPNALKGYLQKAEGLGYHSVWVQEQILGRAVVLESVTLLTFAAAVTRRVRLGPSVLITPLRNPVHLAKSLATLDRLSEGRLTVGVGIGGNLKIYPAFGLTPERRVTRFVEGIRVMKRLWTEERVTFEGRFTRLEDAAMEPKPIQKPHPPIWFGARTPEALRRAVELGDGWMGAGSSSIEDFEQQVNALRGLLAAAGRDAAAFPLSKRVYIGVDPEKQRAMAGVRQWFAAYYNKPEEADRVAVAGPLEECVAALRRLRAGGADMILLNPVYDEERHMELFAKEILPAFT